ncbi:MAG: lipoyl synthase [Paludibacter sp.]|nr:lipoyl synthase [Bacteroidales bacterium]MCM1069053.1 lipoyl synthase [Prevotella sp.]MCM1353492.1 lipoyl synthase [Bacteroides sp.]MCM1442653.1 lipoyl synthase [Muribaculum sp.]MCM1481710.1 lipoyl synthase [Paludibacter sp.]
MHITRKPEWLKIKRTSADQYALVSGLVGKNCLHTICQSGKCPNQAECWSRGTATFMILGDICTRGCKFCATTTGKPLPPDSDEPLRLAESVKAMHLRHVVLTSVTRDDLPDQGAEHWKQCINAIRRQCPDTTIEILTADFDAREELIRIVAEAKPDIFSHNLETVRRITPFVRSKATYEGSLRTLSTIRSLGFRTKTGIMLGLGETHDEILQTMDDARAAGVTILTIGQYLQPSGKHYPVQDYITPQAFAAYKQIALTKGFSHVESAPLVRSSYHAEEAMGD